MYLNIKKIYLDTQLGTKFDTGLDTQNVSRDKVCI